MKELSIGNLKVRTPIIQGGMGVAISLSGLASSVANEGGIGVISAVGVGMNETDYKIDFPGANQRALRKEIKKARSLTDGILGVNIMLAVTDYKDLIQICIDEKINVIFLGAGLPLQIPVDMTVSELKKLNTKFIPKLSSAKAVSVILQYWSNKYNHVPDAFVIEGPLAGGHLGFKKEELIEPVKPLSSIIKETVRVIKPYEKQFKKEIPCIAAGGIYTGADIYDIFQYGAKAVKMGTRFVTTHECDASLEFKESYLNCKKEDIVIIDSPVGLPGRVIMNNFVKQINRGEEKPFKCNWRCLKNCDFKNIQYCIAETLHNSAKGIMTEGFSFAGANAYKAKKLLSVKETIRELVSEYDEIEKVMSNKHKSCQLKVVAV